MNQAERKLTRMAPVELACPAGGECAYITPPLEATDALELLKIHERTCHKPSTAPPNSESKPEKFPRPIIGIDETSEKWDDFTASWRQYKLEYKLDGPRLTRQLYACCSPDLATGLSRSCGGQHFTLDEETLLTKMKELSVQYQNPAVYVQSFLDIRQQEDENVRHFLSRLKGIASRCEFNTKCSCGLTVSYTDSVILFKLVSGLFDDEIKEDILSKGESSLEDTVKSIEAKESAKRAKSSLVNATTQAQISKVGDNSMVSDGHKVKGCSHCGRKEHQGSYEERKLKCPAFDKQCKKCGRTGHFQAKCLSKNRQVKADTKEVTTSEASGVESISVGIDKSCCKET